MAAGQADSTPTPRAHPARRRTNPGSTPSDGGRNPDRHPQVADKPRTDRHATHPPPGDGRWAAGQASNCLLYSYTGIRQSAKSVTAAAQGWLGQARGFVATVGAVEVDPGRDDLVDPVENLAGQHDVGGAELALQVLHGPGADDGRGYGRMVDHEGDRQVHQGQPGVLGQDGELLGRLQFGLIARQVHVEALRYPVRPGTGREVGVLAVAARQPSPGQRAPGYDAHPVAAADRQYLVLDAAHHDRVRRLLTDEPLPAAPLGGPLCLDDL